MRLTAMVGGKSRYFWGVDIATFHQVSDVTVHWTVFNNHLLQYRYRYNIADTPPSPVLWISWPVLPDLAFFSVLRIRIQLDLELFSWIRIRNYLFCIRIQAKLERIWIHNTGLNMLFSVYCIIVGIIIHLFIQVLRAPLSWFLPAFSEGNLFGDGKCRELGKKQVPYGKIEHVNLARYSWIFYWCLARGLNRSTTAAIAITNVLTVNLLYFLKFFRCSPFCTNF